jgi:hypothetical protein
MLFLVPAGIVCQQPPVVTTSVTLTISGATLSDVCKHLSSLLNMTISVEAALADRRVLAFSRTQPPLAALQHLVASLEVSLRPTETGYEIYRTEEQEKREKREEEASRRRYDQAVREASAKLASKINASLTSPKVTLGTFLKEFSPQQRDQMIQMAQQPMGGIYVEHYNNLRQRMMGVRPFGTLSASEQSTIKTLLSNGGYQFSGLQGPPPDLANTSVGIIAAFGSLSLGIIGQNGKDIWYDPVNSISAPSFVSGQEISTVDLDPEIEQLRNSGKLVKRLGVSWKKKTVRFASLKRLIHLPEVLKEIHRQTSLPFFGACYLNTEYLTFPLEGIRENVEIPLPEVLEIVCFAYGQQMEMKEGVIHVTTLTPGLDRRMERSRPVLTLLSEKASAKEPTLTEQEFLTLCTLPPTQLLRLPYQLQQKPWVKMMLPQLSDSFLSVNFLAALSDEQRAQAKTTEGLPLSSLPRELQQRGLLIAQSGTYPQSSEPLKNPLHFYYRVHSKQLPDVPGEVLQKVVLVFVSEDGVSKEIVFAIP